ncbi:MAG: tol-pal system protein YbgF [Gammaproteobacteria bacterium]|nr:tol-pal system protein YbgF [Gammaproteobacteria bacterium]MCP4832197.1 tol-pal system protein YbgF [Gammaproteobacteria bacterium]MCP4928166.1 tol-pal system protein YbgF [Gammaproteobacteria bacterium]
MITGAANAQSTKQRITQLEQQVARMERILENGQEVQTDMLLRIQELQKENQTLRNEIETLQFESNRSGSRQRELYIDLDQRLQEIEAGGAGNNPVTGSSPGAAVAGNPKDTTAYQAAFDQLKQANYEKAGDAFTAFLNDYPNSQLRDNAQYWLAETHYVSKSFPAALDGFQKVISEYPASRKVPDAWLKIGYCNYELEQWTPARQALTTLVTQYPETTAARLAKERLTLMDSNGI